MFKNYIIGVCLVLINAQFCAASSITELKRVVINEVYDAHKGHYLAPTCATIMEIGYAAAQDPDRVEYQFRSALDAGLLGRERFYLGMVELARNNMDFDTMAAECLNGLPKENHRYESMSLASVLSDTI